MNGSEQCTNGHNEIRKAEVRIDDGKALRDVGDFAPSIADDPTVEWRKVVVIR